MSPEQMARVRATVNALNRSGAELGAGMIDRLGDRAPGTLRLLASDEATAGAAVISELRTFCELVGDFAALRTWAHGLGAATGAAVTASELHAIGGALVDTLRDVLGPQFQEPDLDAWRCGVALVIELMR